MAGVVRNLVDNHKLRIVVDCSPNSVDELLLKSEREDIIEVQEMTQDMISIIPQFQQLHTIIKQAELTEVVWKVLGGIPVKYERLWMRLGK